MTEIIIKYFFHMYITALVLFNNKEMFSFSIVATHAFSFVRNLVKYPTLLCSEQVKCILYHRSKNSCVFNMTEIYIWIFFN